MSGEVYMTKKEQENELLNKIINLGLTYSIKNSEFYLKLLENQIDFYKIQIDLLEDTKPLFFQKKKLEEHNKKIAEYEQKIYETYQQMNEEVDLIIKMRESISD
jgi:3-methyladenine DNA glycosylase AlkC